MRIRFLPSMFERVEREAREEAEADTQEKLYEFYKNEYYKYLQYQSEVEEYFMSGSVIKIFIRLLKLKLLRILEKMDD